MPTLNGSRNFYKPKSLTESTIGLSELRLDATSPGF
jgi:hypothetical protein